MTQLVVQRLCLVTVEASQETVAGVNPTRIDLAKKTATITFDANKANAAARVKATTDAGLPWTVRQ